MFNFIKSYMMRENIFLLFFLSLAVEIYPQWVRTTSPAFVYCFAISGTNVLAGTNERVFLSSDDGTSWTAANSGLAEPVLSLGVSRANLFAGTNTGVFLSTNSGASWTEVDSGLTDKYVNCLAVIDTNLFAGGTYGLFFSTNSGTSWTEVDSGLTDKYVKCLAVIDTNLFAGTMDGGGVFLSTNNGASWTGVNAGLPSNMGVYALAVIGTNLFSGGGNGVFLSTNSGTSWTEVDSGLTEKYVVSLAITGANLFAKTTGGVFLSTNSGASWAMVNEGLTSTGGPGTLEVSGANLLLGTSFTGIWRRALAQMITSVEELSNESPECFYLSQNYPDPFNPVTTIRFSIPNASKVTIKIYDVLGKEIETLVNEEKPVGTYELNWNAANLPSGVYFYQLKAGSYIATKKLLLLK